MKVFGHPIHIMLIHFPAALFPMDLVCSGIALYNGETTFATAAYFAGFGGVVIGWLAILFGGWDMIRLYEKRQDAMPSMLLHGGMNSLVVIIFTILVYMKSTGYPLLAADNIGILILKAIAVCLMLFGNFIGGQLILKYKVVE